MFILEYKKKRKRKEKKTDRFLYKENQVLDLPFTHVIHIREFFYIIRPNRAELLRLSQLHTPFSRMVFVDLVRPYKVVRENIPTKKIIIILKPSFTLKCLLKRLLNLFPKPVPYSFAMCKNVLRVLSGNTLLLSRLLGKW